MDESIDELRTRIGKALLEGWFIGELAGEIRGLLKVAIAADELLQVVPTFTNIMGRYVEVENMMLVHKKMMALGNAMDELKGV